MAGDWIKVECVTPSKPEVFKIAELCEIEPEHAFGCLVSIWIWADQHTEKGNAPSVTKKLLERISGVSGFADAMLEVGWLVLDEFGATFPNFDRHNGKTAKNRALTAKRVANHKEKSNAKGNARGNATSVSSALPREEKRRDIKNSTANAVEQKSAAAATAEHPKPDKFPMALDWHPNGTFQDRCLQSGLDPGRIPHAMLLGLLGEFRSYWTTQPGREQSQSQWEHKFLQRLIPLHQSGELYATRQRFTGAGVAGIDWSDTSWYTPEFEAELRDIVAGRERSH